MKPQLASPKNDQSPMHYKSIQGKTPRIQAPRLSYEELFIRKKMTFDLPHASSTPMTFHILYMTQYIPYVAIHIPHVSLGLHYISFIT